MRKVIPFILALMCAASSAYAALEPQEIVTRQNGNQKTIEKVYVLPSDEPEEPIPTDSFTEGDLQYDFVELLREDNSYEDSKDYSESASINTKTGDTDTVKAGFEPTKEVTTEDGYSGVLEADFTTLKVESAGTGSQSYTITERRSYPNMNSADTSAVPKSIDKNGTTLELTDIEWVSASNNNIDGQELAVSYTANAVYTGTGTRTYSKGYVASVEYKGVVNKMVSDTVKYTAVFQSSIPDGQAAVSEDEPQNEQEPAPKEPEKSKAKQNSAKEKKFSPIVIMFIILSVFGIAACAYLIYKMERKKGGESK